MPRIAATSSIAALDSQPRSRCAIVSADITADWRWSAGYLAISRSMRARASGDNGVIDRSTRTRCPACR
jgi:hypothetical protein